MPRLVCDTRFFVECFFSDDMGLQFKAKDLLAKNKDRYVSAVTLHELYLLELTRRGREIAKLRVQGVQDVFRVAGVNSRIAISAAEIRAKYRVPMGDSLIAATCQAVHAQCVTDDPHLAEMKEIKTRWI
jgi:predicted nucleic acid-binding protein